MGIRVYKPTSNGRRNMSVSTYEEITTTTPEKSLLAPIKSNGGRNNTGKITVRHQNIVLLISSVIKMVFLLALLVLNTIQIEVQTLHY